MLPAKMIQNGAIVAEVQASEALLFHVPAGKARIYLVGHHGNNMTRLTKLSTNEQGLRGEIPAVFLISVLRNPVIPLKP